MSTEPFFVQNRIDCDKELQSLLVMATQNQEFHPETTRWFNYWVNRLYKSPAFWGVDRNETVLKECTEQLCVKFLKAIGSEALQVVPQY